MCREFHRVMAHEGLFTHHSLQVRTGETKRPNVVTERYEQQAIQKATVELSQQQNRQAWESYLLASPVPGGNAG